MIQLFAIIESLPATTVCFKLFLQESLNAMSFSALEHSLIRYTHTSVKALNVIDMGVLFEILKMDLTHRGCFASQQTIADNLGLTRPSVHQSLLRLLEHNIIQKRASPHGMTHTYFAVEVHFWKEPIPNLTKQKLHAKPEPVNKVCTPCKRPLHPPVNDVSTNKNNLKKNKIRISVNDVYTPPDPVLEPTAAPVGAKAAFQREKQIDELACYLQRARGIQTTPKRVFEGEERERWMQANPGVTPIIDSRTGLPFGYG